MPIEQQTSRGRSRDVEAAGSGGASGARIVGGCGFCRTSAEHLAEISELRSSLATDGAGADGFGRLVHHFEDYRDRTLDEIERVANFARELPPGVKLAIAPEIEAGVRDLAALSRVAGYVTSGTALLKPLQAAARVVAGGRQAETGS